MYTYEECRAHQDSLQVPRGSESAMVQCHPADGIDSDSDSFLCFLHSINKTNILYKK